MPTFRAFDLRTPTASTPIRRWRVSGWCYGTTMAKTVNLRMTDTAERLVDEYTDRTGTSQNAAINELIELGHAASVEAGRARARTNRERYSTVMDALA